MTMCRLIFLVAILSIVQTQMIFAQPSVKRASQGKAQQEVVNDRDFKPFENQYFSVKIPKQLEYNPIMAYNPSPFNDFIVKESAIFSAQNTGGKSDDLTIHIEMVDGRDNSLIRVEDAREKENQQVLSHTSLSVGARQLLQRRLKRFLSAQNRYIYTLEYSFYQGHTLCVMSVNSFRRKSLDLYDAKLRYVACSFSLKRHIRQ